MLLERFGQLKESNYIGYRNRDLPACSIVPLRYGVLFWGKVLFILKNK
jgi:hypothetical protein